MQASTGRALFNIDLINYIYLYLKSPDDGQAEILFQNVQTAINQMIESDATIPVISHYIVSSTQTTRMMGVKDLTSKVKRVKRMVSLIYPDEAYSEKVARQILIFIVMAATAIDNNPQTAEIVNDILAKVPPHQRE